MNTIAIVKKLKDVDQDFEWYPTTQTMIDFIKKDMINYFNKYEDQRTVLGHVNILDCGAGDGRVLKQLANGGKKYAIEKSKTLIDQMPNDLFIIGTDFFQSTLIDKSVDVVFSNPPYSEYTQWAQKIILESNAKMVYLILPKRWQGSNVINQAIESRQASFKIIGSSDFFDAERSARATVDIISIKLMYDSRNNHQQKTDPFDIWFENNFKLDSEKESQSESDTPEQAKTLKEKVHNQLTSGKGIVPVLVELYNQEMDHIQKMFLSVCELDADILNELGISSKGLKEALKQRISGLKTKYWKELFDNYDKITKRLTKDSREKILDKLNSHTSIDFTESNIYALSVWVIKNANQYYDSQLVDIFERMVNAANVTLYKSNKRVFTDQDWRYSRKPNELSHYGLDLRIVLHNMGGIKTDSWSYSYTNKLSDSAHNFLDDITTIASNLGFELPSWVTSRQITEEWKSNQSQVFYMNKGQDKILMTVKAFMNGNIHIKFNQDFIRTLNVEFGRLKGWLTNHIQASEELNMPVKQTERFFQSNYRLTQAAGLLQIGM